MYSNYSASLSNIILILCIGQITKWIFIKVRKASCATYTYCTITVGNFRLFFSSTVVTRSTGPISAPFASSCSELLHWEHLSCWVSTMVRRTHCQGSTYAQESGTCTQRWCSRSDFICPAIIANTNSIHCQDWFYVVDPNSPMGLCIRLPLLVLSALHRIQHVIHRLILPSGGAQLFLMSIAWTFLYLWITQAVEDEPTHKP